MTIDQLKAEIERVGSLLAAAEWRYAKFSCFADAGKVSDYEMQLRRLTDALEQKQRSSAA